VCVFSFCTIRFIWETARAPADGMRKKSSDDKRAERIP